MKKITLLLLMCLPFLTQASDIILSDITNNLYMAIQGWSHKSVGQTNELVQFDDEMVWHPFCTTGNVEINYPNPAHGIKIKMLGADGKEIQKTALGKSYGSKWDQLHSPLDNDPNHIGGITASRGTHDPREIFTGPILSSPSELFQIEKPGIYTFEIQMQMFRHSSSSDTNEWMRNLFSFPPIKIKVEKPPEK